MKYISAIAAASLLSISLVGFLPNSAHADNHDNCPEGQTYNEETQACEDDQ